MHIAINLRSYVQGHIGGMETYVRHIVAGIATAQHAAGQPLTLFARPAELDHVRRLAPHAQLHAINQDPAGPQLAAALKQGTYDLLFCPLLVLEPLQFDIPSAVMMPDLQHEFFPEFFDPHTLRWYQRCYPLSAHAAQVIFTLSDYTKKTILQKWPVDPHKIEIIPLGVEPEFQLPPSAEALATVRSFDLPQDYVLFPANFWPHKNHTRLLHALRQLVQGRHLDLPDLSNLGLVLTGEPETGAQRITQEIETLGLQRHVRLLGYLERPVLVAVYHQARALAFVSQFEGFGLPLLEAFHTGLPVLSSRAESCVEIAAGAALHVDANDPSAIAGGLQHLLSNPAVCQELVKKGTARSQDFSWPRAITMTLAAFERIVRPAPAQISLQSPPLTLSSPPSQPDIALPVSVLLAQEEWILELEHTTIERQHALEQADAALQTLTAALTTRNTQLEEFQGIAEERRIALETMHTELQEMKAEAERRVTALQELTAALTVRDTQIAQLNQIAQERLAALEETHTALQAREAELRDCVQAFQNESLLSIITRRTQSHTLAVYQRLHQKFHQS